jgi:hypothetical protein
MKRTMNEVSVKVEDGQVVICQPNTFTNESGEDCIYLDYGQIGLLVEWLVDAKEEVVKLPESK